MQYLTHAIVRYGCFPRRFGNNIRNDSHCTLSVEPLFPYIAARILPKSSRLFLHRIHSTEVGGSSKSSNSSWFDCSATSFCNFSISEFRSDSFSIRAVIVSSRFCNCIRRPIISASFWATCLSTSNILSLAAVKSFFTLSTVMHCIESASTSFSKR